MFSHRTVISLQLLRQRDSSCDWNVVTNSYLLCRKDRPGKWVSGITLYVCKQMEFIELCLEGDEEMVQSWVRIKGQAKMRDICLGVCYRMPDQEGTMTWWSSV